MAKIYVIHENDEWTAPLIDELEARGVEYEDWHLDQGQLDLSAVPPEGVFYNRMSASSHTRGHRYAPEYTAAVLEWLENHDRTVINSRDALRLEVSKVAQYTALEAAGIRTPKTIAAVGKANIIEAAEKFEGAFITKDNRAGKGLGVKLFHDVGALEEYLNSPEFELSVDGITLVQEYIDAPDNFITRCEFIGQEFFYAVQVDSSEGFELCPADQCEVGDEFCPIAGNKFEIVEDFHDPILAKYREFLVENGIHVAGIEFIKNAEGEIFTYDVNTNTNYNSAAEGRAGLYGMKRVAEFLQEKLERLGK